MKIYCAILGFPIEREVVCGSSGNHPLCRKCSGRESEKVDPSPVKGRIKGKCERCSVTFVFKSNRQRLCPKCQGLNETIKNREYQACFRKKHKDGLGVRG